MIKKWKRKRIFFSILRFEGDYLNNTKIKGSEFSKGKIIYKGDYLYNRKWKGKEYDEYGNLIYELLEKSLNMAILMEK